jgi:uncharacterized protein (DUF1330 family)
MPAYVIAQVTVRDAATYQRYRELAPISIAAYGGRYLARGGATMTLTGGWQPTRLVVVEFPSVGEARAWWDSPEYAEAKSIREASADAQIVLTEGLTSEAAAAITAAASPAARR